MIKNRYLKMFFLNVTKSVSLILIMFVQTLCFSQSKITFSKDKKEYYKTQTENVNGCQKIISWKSYNVKSKKIKEEWSRAFAKDSNQTCDFSAYIILIKKYKKGKLIEVKQYFSGSEESEEIPCGVWNYYNTKGKIINAIKHEKCDLTIFGRN